MRWGSVFSPYEEVIEQEELAGNDLKLSRECEVWALGNLQRGL